MAPVLPSPSLVGTVWAPKGLELANEQRRVTLHVCDVTADEPVREGVAWVLQDGTGGLGSRAEWDQWVEEKEAALVR